MSSAHAAHVHAFKEGLIFHMFYFQAAFLKQATWYVSRVTCPGVTCRECDAKTSFKHSHPDIIQNTPARSGQRRSCLSLNPPRRHGRVLHALSDCIFQLAGQGRHIQTCEQCMTMFSSYLLRIFNIQSFKEAMLTLNWDTCLQNLHQWFWSTMIQKTDLPYICPNLRWRRL